MMSHSGEKKTINCYHCDFIQSGAGNLREHSEAHTGEKTYMCVLCDIIFKKRGYSKTHRYNNMANRYEAGHGHDAGIKNENSQNLHSNNQIH